MNSRPRTLEFREADAAGYRAAEVPPEMQMLSEQRREGFLRAFKSIQDRRARIKAYAALSASPGATDADPGSSGMV
jgi:hypothetical protein